MECKDRAWLLLGCLLIACPGVAEGAFLRLPVGARTAALCDALQCAPGELSALDVNPALLPGISSLSFGFHYVPGHFGLKELRRAALSAAVPAGTGAAGALIQAFGSSLYRELTVTAAFGLRLSPRVDAGAALSVYSLAVAGYGHAVCLGLHAGVCFRLAEELLLGASLRNINRPVLGLSREPVPLEILAGVQYQLPGPLRLHAGLSKDERSGAAVSVGAEVELAGVVILRAGAQEGFSRFGWGAGFVLKGVRLDYGLVTHMALGPTQHLSFQLPGLP